jgi:hypothetical protein
MVPAARPVATNTAPAVVKAPPVRRPPASTRPAAVFAKPPVAEPEGISLAALPAVLEEPDLVSPLFPLPAVTPNVSPIPPIDDESGEPGGDEISAQPD